MTTTPSLRRLWSMYKELLVADGISRREQVLAQGAFYSGARAIFKVLNHLLEHGQDDELRRTIQPHGRQIKALQGPRPRGH
jgi:hypothetical protein